VHGRAYRNQEFSMNDKTASVHWQGSGKQGLGKISTETGALKDYPYGFASRFEDDRRGTNPEEILGAAHTAKRDCPLSKALASVPEITLMATLR
jgi:organic hydroperoxide reductase OsmC/OhrA